MGISRFILQTPQVGGQVVHLLVGEPIGEIDVPLHRIVLDDLHARALFRSVLIAPLESLYVMKKLSSSTVVTVIGWPPGGVIVVVIASGFGAGGSAGAGRGRRRASTAAPAAASAAGRPGRAPCPAASARW